MSRNGKVIVAMSGGVDSSVAAYLLKEQGYDCVGVFMRVGTQAAEPETDLSCALEPGAADAQPQRRLKHGCCSAADAIDARAIAGRLDIPFYALNFEADFDRIINYFVDEYSHARTPNPCVMCNIHLKFGKLLRYADAMDAEFVATGHYARVVDLRPFKKALGRSDTSIFPVGATAEGDTAVGGCATPALARSLNREKDQSYVLFGIRREDLGRCLFPLGEMTDKAVVREMAADLGLRVHDKPDSQEICFVPNNDYKQLVRARRPETQRDGVVKDAHGAVIGTHEGIANYTIGQRRGLGIAAGKPIYVVKLDVLQNEVTVGEKADLLSDGLVADGMNWLLDPPGETTRVEIKIRHMHTPAAGLLTMREDGTAFGKFNEPQPAVTPGQAAVFYRPDGVVIGGGWIREALADR